MEKAENKVWSQPLGPKPGLWDRPTHHRNLTGADDSTSCLLRERSDHRGFLAGKSGAAPCRRPADMGQRPHHTPPGPRTRQDIGRPQRPILEPWSTCLLKSGPTGLPNRVTSCSALLGTSLALTPKIPNPRKSSIRGQPQLLTLVSPPVTYGCGEWHSKPQGRAF